MVFFRSINTLIRSNLRRLGQISLRYFRQVEIGNHNASKQKTKKFPLSILYAAGIAISLPNITKIHNLSPQEEDVLFLKQINNQRTLFEKFSSMELDGVRYMAPIDILRALSLTHKIEMDQISQEALIQITQLFQLADLNFDGKITFDEFSFFLKLLTTPPDHFLIAFKMFDMDQSGSLEYEEFEKVLGKQKGSPSMSSSRSQHGSLASKWFGNNSKSMKFHEFENFMTTLQNKVTQSQFIHFADSQNTISGHYFAKLVLSHGNLLSKSCHRLESLPEQLSKSRVTYQDYLAFEKVLSDLDDLEIAIRVTYSGNRINKDEFKRGVECVAAQKVNENVIDILFHILDRNGDGNVSLSDYMVLKKMRGMFGEVKSDPGLTGRILSYIECVRN